MTSCLISKCILISIDRAYTCSWYSSSSVVIKWPFSEILPLFLLNAQIPWKFNFARLGKVYFSFLKKVNCFYWTIKGTIIFILWGMVKTFHSI